MQARPSSRYTLAYDADCGPCTRFAHIVNSLDKHEKIDFIPLVVADQHGLLDGISAPLRYRSFHLISPNGEAKSGCEADLVGTFSGPKVIFCVILFEDLVKADDGQDNNCCSSY
jgi:hypothetical protein